ncbi:MAG: glycosyltransferase [Gomphosphaeria aponina SAG 52.96 = DSM 107014]|uniref:Glycosyltransferase n=1 Tax=Gomphosphaeria aponina SAG 52.96 = DSM 107014 TaxID=1521640 RepID=A0A941GNL8_9CHRO|nr:glycosyltransferase [Gomphosphaeria aponina SAG 52.96 = DSM 107014]
MMKIIIVGGTGGTNVADAFMKASQKFNIESYFLSFLSAYEAPKLIKQFNWHIRGKYPTKLNTFSQEILEECLNNKPNLLLTTGITPINSQALQQIGKLGIKRLNFLTDDPWNKAHYPPWFFQCLPHYDVIFTPRRANIDDLKNIGCRDVKYLPFGYDPDLFYPEIPTDKEKENYIADVMFAGGADSDRIPYIDALIKAGMKVNLYGTYWERFPETKAYTRGQADVKTLRLAIKSTKIALCLVRQANRDGHVMRSFEVPAVGACMLTEDTPEHREIFGEEGENVIYFKTIPEMLAKARWLLDNESERLRLANNAYKLITKGGNTYGDRLQYILKTLSGEK